jgi:hypothetical protein
MACRGTALLLLKGVSAIEIHRRMQVYGDDCVDVSIVRRLANRCKDGEPEKSDLCDRQRIERPVTETGEFPKEQVVEMIKENRRITQRQIEKVGRHKNNVLLQRDKARPLRVLPWKQLARWISTSSHIRHTVQTWRRATFVSFQK